MGDGLHDVLRRAQTGDPPAIEELIEAFGPVVRRQCDVFSNTANELSVADCYQEALLRVWLQLPGFQGDPDPGICRAKFEKWLRVTTRHVLINLQEHRRAARRRPPGGVRNAATWEGMVAIDEGLDSPSECAMRAEQAMEVRAAIAGLDPDARTMIELIYFHEMSLAAAARRLEITYEQARGEFARAMQLLTRILGNH